MKSKHCGVALPLLLALVVVGCKTQTSNSQPPAQQPAPAVKQPAPVVQQPSQASVASRSRILKETPATMTETNAVVALRSLNTAEVMYSANQSSYAFTCQMANLIAVDPDLSGPLRELRGDYKVTLAGCDGPPATKYRIIAVAEAPEVGFRAFCVSEDAVIRYANDGKQESCVGSRLEGEVANEPQSEPQEQAEQRATVQRVSGEAVSQFQILSTQKKFYNPYSHSFFVELKVRNNTTHDLRMFLRWYATDGGVDVKQGNCTAMSVRPDTTAEIECCPLVIGHPNAEIKLGEPSLQVN